VSGQSRGLMPGWRWVRFGEVVELVRETCRDPVSEGIERVVGIEHIEPDDLRIASWASSEEVTTFTQRFRRGQVLFARRRAYQRKVAIAEFDGICSGDIYVFEAKGALLPALLPFICQTTRFFEHAVGNAAGSLSPRTKWESLAALEIPLPPLDEQAVILRSLSSAEETLQANRILAISLEGVLASISERYSTAFGAHLDDSGTVRAAELPNGWRLASIAELCAGRGGGMTLGPFGSDLIAADYAHPSGVPVVFVADVTRAGFKYTSHKFVSVPKAKDLAAHEAAPGDVLVTKMGWPPGEACVVPAEAPVTIITADIVRARVSRSLVLPEYLSMVINSNWGQHQIVRIAPGTTRPKFTLRDFEKIRVATPPVSVQEGACQRVSEIRLQMDECGARVRSLKDLRHALAERLLGGGYVY